jgi:hypothetical protein
MFPEQSPQQIEGQSRIGVSSPPLNIDLLQGTQYTMTSSTGIVEAVAFIGDRILSVGNSP